jgi:hypothetical protein
MPGRSSLALALLCAVAAAPQLSAQRVVASTSWTAAFARAAGATQVTTIAPAELQHPPEYDIKPSDLEAVGNAALVVYGGYEKFARRLAETSAGSGTRTLQVFTDNAPGAVKAQARRIAEAIGTVSVHEQWIVGFDALAEQVRREVQAAWPDRRAVVQKMQRSFAEWLGFEVVGEFGPAEPSPAVVLDLVRAKPALVIDNYHNPSGRAIAESLKAPYAALINFPGKDGTRSIEDLYRHNAQLLLAAAGRR